MQFSDMTIVRTLAEDGAPIILTDRSQICAPGTYHTRDTQGRDSVLKVVSSSRYHDLAIEDQADLKTMGMTLFGIRNTRLVRTLTKKIDNGYLAFLFAFAHGQEMKKALMQNGTALPVTEVLQYLCDVCEGLSQLHRNQMAHLDLKPGNIFVITDRTTGQRYLRIGDLGSVRLVHPNGQRPSIALCGVTGITPSYASPELLLDPVNGAGVAADIWACGVLLYEMLYGQRPYDLANNNDRKAWYEEARGFHLTMASSLPQVVQKLIQGCLRVPPQQRYPDAMALLHHTRHALHSLSTNSAGVRAPLAIGTAAPSAISQPSVSQPTQMPAVKQVTRSQSSSASLTSKPHAQPQYAEYEPYARRVREAQESVDRLRGNATPKSASPDQKKEVASALYQLAQVYTDGLEYHLAVRTMEETLAWSPQHPFVPKELKMMRSYGGPTDLREVCRDCKKPYVISVGEQQWFARRGWQSPKSCKDCRGAEKLTGIVKFYNARDGYGYIVPDASTGISADVKLEKAHLPGNFVPSAGQRVRFTVVFENRRFQAREVRLMR